MKNRRSPLLLSLLIPLALVLSACSVHLERNPDKSWTVSSEMDEADIQEAINEAIADPLIRSLTADLREAYVWVTAERERLDGSRTDTLTFRLDLGVADGHLTAVISQAGFNGEPVEEARVALWNERIANRLERRAGRRPNSTLQSVAISADVLTITWRVEPQR